MFLLAYFYHISVKFILSFIVCIWQITCLLSHYILAVNKLIVLDSGFAVDRTFSIAVFCALTVIELWMCAIRKKF